MDRDALSAYSIKLVTAADSDLGYTTRGVSFAVEGALRVTTENDEDVTIPSGSLAAGVIHPLRVKRIWSTGTGATSIVAYL